MIVGIITTPNRQDYLPNIIKKVGKHAKKIIISNDTEFKGQWWNASNLYNQCLEEAVIGEPVLLMTDDVDTVDNWYDKFIEIHKQFNHDVYTFYSGMSHIKNWEGSRLGVHKKNFYDPAVIIFKTEGNANLIKDIFSWIDSVRDNPKYKRVNSFKHFDVAVQEYFVYHNRPWVHVVPNLFNHVGVISTLGHKCKGSHNYIGDYDL